MTSKRKAIRTEINRRLNEWNALSEAEKASIKRRFIDLLNEAATMTVGRLALGFNTEPRGTSKAEEQ
jgi:hypothetical protein